MGGDDLALVGVDEAVEVLFQDDGGRAVVGCGPRLLQERERLGGRGLVGGRRWAAGLGRSGSRLRQRGLVGRERTRRFRGQHGLVGQQGPGRRVERLEHRLRLGGIAEHGVLGLHQAAAVVVIVHQARGDAGQLQQRAVVRILQRGGKRVGKVGLVQLARRLGRGEDDPVRRGEQRDVAAAAFRGEDEILPRGDAGEGRLEIGRLHPRAADLKDRSRHPHLAMAEKDEPEGIGRGQPGRQLREAGLEGFRRHVRRRLDICRGDAARDKGGGEPVLQRLEAIAFLLIAGKAGDDQHMGCRFRAEEAGENGQQQQSQGQDAAAHPAVLAWGLKIGNVIS